MLWLQIDTIKTMKLVEAAAAAETCSEKNSMNLMELAWTKLSYRHLNICFYLNDSLSLAFVCCHCYCKWQMVCLFFAANPSLSVQLLSFPCFEPVCFFLFVTLFHLKHNSDSLNLTCLHCHCSRFLSKDIFLPCNS